MSDERKPAPESGKASDPTREAVASTSEDVEDLWAAAMNEQGVEPEPEAPAQPSAQPSPQSSTPPASDSADLFPSFDADSGARQTRDLSMVMDIPVQLSVELGRTRITIKQLLELAQGSVVELDGLAGEPMDILINGYLIAQGEVVVVEDKYGIRITEIVTPSERVQKLNR